MPQFKNRTAAALNQAWPAAATELVSDVELDRLVDDVTDSVIDGRRGDLSALFERVRSPTPPVVTWGPDDLDLANHPRLAHLHRFWQQRRRGAGLPLSSTIDPLELGPALGYVMLMEPVGGGEDFLYRLYGTAIADRSGLEMTGKRVRDVPVPLVAVYFLATYRAVLMTRRPLYTRHSTHHAIGFDDWSRLILPFDDAEGRIDRLLVGNVPLRRQIPSTR